MSKKTNKISRGHKVVIQSYLSVIGKYESDTYTERVLSKIAENYQHLLEGKTINKDLKIFFEEDQDVSFMIDELFDDGRQVKFTKLVDAIVELTKKVFELRYKNESGEEVYRVYTFLTDSTIMIDNRKVTVRINKNFLNDVFNFEKGYRRYEYKFIFSLSSVYAIRMYKFICSQNIPIEMDLQKFKEIFGMTSKIYDKPYRLCALLDRINKELEETGVPRIFDYEIDNKKGTIRIRPLKNMKYNWKPGENDIVDDDRKSKYVMHDAGDEAFAKMREAGFTRQDFAKNQEMLSIFFSLPDAMERLDVFIAHSKEKKNLKAYILKLMRDYICLKTSRVKYD